MKAIAILIACLAAASASAQNTWGGLHFNQAREEVRAQLASQGIEVETSQEGSLQSTADYQLLLPNLRNPLPMLAGFHFSTSNTLSDVTLTLDVPGMRRYWAALGSDEVLLDFAADKLAASISGKYGAPLYRSPACEAEGKAPAGFCSITWRGPDQTVEMERVPSPHGARLLVRYQPLSAAL